MLERKTGFDGVEERALVMELVPGDTLAGAATRNFVRRNARC